MPRYLLLLLLSSSLTAACASTAGGDSKTAGKDEGPQIALRITWRDYRTGSKLELVSESHTDPLHLYSKPRPTADTKVQTDDIMKGLLDYFDQEGFSERALPGKAPLGPGGAGGTGGGGRNLTQALEVERPEGVSHLIGGPGASVDDRKLLSECLAVFVGVYNETYGLQSAQNEAGAQYFDQQKKKLVQKH